MKSKKDLEEELSFLGLLDKAIEIYFELGERAVLSYIKSSYRLLSKVYHPDVNPDNRVKAEMTQQRLNKVNRLIGQMSDEELVELIKSSSRRSAKSKKKILVVEDEASLQEIFKDVFVMEGYDVRVAIDGQNGFKLYCKFEPELVFTDIIMPKMNGIELVEKIRGLNPQIKVVYISGFLGIKKLRRKLDSEVLRYGYCALSKPFKISAMLHLVKDYMNNDLNDPSRVNIFA